MSPAAPQGPPRPLRAVILCAGASSRLGEPKALARLGRQTALEWLLEAVSAVDPRPIVVAGRHFAEIDAHLGRRVSLPCTPVLIENSRWRDGRTGSLACAVHEAPGADLLVAPVDVPLVGQDVILALGSSWARAGSPDRGWLAPWTQEGAASMRRYGHPVVLGAELAGSLLRAAEPARPLSRFRAEAQPLLGFEVDDMAIHDDLDTPEDLARLRERLRSQA